MLHYYWPALKSSKYLQVFLYLSSHSYLLCLILAFAKIIVGTFYLPPARTFEPSLLLLASSLPHSPKVKCWCYFLKNHWKPFQCLWGKIWTLERYPRLYPTWPQPIRQRFISYCSCPLPNQPETNISAISNHLLFSVLIQFLLSELPLTPLYSGEVLGLSHGPHS